MTYLTNNIYLSPMKIYNDTAVVGEPSKIKRHWLSIITQLTKTKYNIECKDFKFTENGKHIRTYIYIFNNL